MRILKPALLIGALSGAVFALSPVAVSASPLASASGKGLTAPVADSWVIEVQGGKKKGGGGGGGARRGGGGGGGNAGAGIAAGVAVGIFGAIAADQARRQNQAVEDCYDRYPNYDAQSRTGWDRRGRPHRCP